MNARGVAHQNRDRDDRAARHERPEQAPEERRAVLAVLAVLALAPRTATRRRAIAAVVAPARGGGPRHVKCPQPAGARLPDVQSEIRAVDSVGRQLSRSIQTCFTHRPVSTFDRVSFQLTDELFLNVMALNSDTTRCRR